MRPRARLLAVATLSLLAACGGGGGSPHATISSTARPITLQVGVASSLADAFTALGAAFEAAHPGSKVRFVAGGSASLAEQLHQGLPFDVMAVADTQTMDKIVAAGDAGDSTVVGRNRLSIAVARGNPDKITGLTDLGRKGLLVSLCGPEVPCGRLAREALRRAGTTVKPASEEDNVTAVVNRVALGEADAGVVYATDVSASAGKVDGVDLGIPDDPALQAVYPMAVTKEAKDPAGARSFIEFVASPAGQSILRGMGFLAP